MSSSEEAIGWVCERCTYVNFPSRPGCEMCTEGRPENYEVPKQRYRKSEAEVEWESRDRHGDEYLSTLRDRYMATLPASEREARRCKNKDWIKVIEMDDEPLTTNNEAFDCPVCFDRVPRGEGVKLKECFDTFCRLCLKSHIQECNGPLILCPSCPAVLQEREIKALVGREGLAKYHSRVLSTAENVSGEEAFHCKKADCSGWSFVDGRVQVFFCPVCSSRNCIPCRALHTGTCEEYNDFLKKKAEWDHEAMQTSTYLQEMLETGEAMHCPRCKIVITKKEGCDWLSCLNCEMEICWVTRGPRWGPKGKGDFSGGCKCRLNGIICHPECHNCH